MQVADAGAGGVAGGADSRDGHRGLGSPGALAAAASEAPRVPGPSQVSGPGGDASSTTGRPETRVHVFALCVPFPSNVEAEIACASLAPDREPHGSVVKKELTVTGSILAIRWRAENPRLLRISIINFLDQLSLVMRTMQRFGPPVSR
ncbi:EKC/KEOPS complex subunit LAGE3 [Suricata suricatta]|nr:EKC/KEOPS complex subunit LAGE3 [Suricata suricatta]